MQASVWVNDGGVYNKREDKIYRTHFILVSYYYLTRRSGLFGKFGLGFSAFNAYDKYEPREKDVYGKALSSNVHSDGLGAALGLGYDFKAADKLFLSLTLTYFYGNLGTLVLNETHILPERKALNLLELNLGLMFRSENR